MSLAKSLFGIAAVAAMANAIIHLAGAAIAVFSSDIMPAMIGIALWSLIALGLFASRRWLAYFAFLLALGGGIYMVAQLGTATPLPSWSVIAIAVLDLFIALILFLLLWRSPAPVDQPG